MDHVLNVNEGGMDKKASKSRTKDLKSKSIKTNACGRHVLNQDRGVEQLLFEKLEEYWADDKRVSRAVRFQTVLGIDPSFKVSGGVGGKSSKEHLKRLKQWFHFGFKQRRYLSNRKISSVEKKLPLRLELDLMNPQKRITACQFPHCETILDEDGDEVSALVPGVDYADTYNFDHVPVWRELVGNYSWGPKYSDRRNAKTG